MRTSRGFIKSTLKHMVFTLKIIHDLTAPPRAGRHTGTRSPHSLHPNPRPLLYLTSGTQELHPELVRRQQHPMSQLHNWKYGKAKK